MQDSPHAARWVNILSDQDWEVMVFPVNSQPPSHEFNKSISIYRKSITLIIVHTLLKWNDQIGGAIVNAIDLPFRSGLLKLNSFIGRLGRSFLASLDSIFIENIKKTKISIPKLHGPHQLLKCIDAFKPDLIHSLEFQHCSYLLLQVKESLGEVFPKWAVTNWGSDIYFYQNYDIHHHLINQVLINADVYFCECHRDVELAIHMGFKGVVAPVGPNIGGLNLEVLKPIRDVVIPSKRNLIVVKGYEGFSGRALIALEAISMCRDFLSNYKVLVYSASPAVRNKIKSLSEDGISIKSLDRLSNMELLKVFAMARIYLGVGVTDGISTSMLEAMSMGAFPIQTNTACCNEWLEDGRSGFIICPDDIEKIASRVKISLKDDVLVDQASKVNWKIAEKRLDLSKNRAKIIDFYFKILDDAE